MIQVNPELLPPGTDKVRTDGVHRNDNTSNVQSPEGKSEAIKVQKAAALMKVIDTLKMDHCMIFVRTKVDADNLENFLIQKSGGARFRPGMEKGLEAEYSCVVLHGDRPPHERKANLAAFKNGDVRFLICTDVAARGLDISGLPFMINYTLPDRSEDYVHRVGRVGRAETMGLAISLVSTVKEKVWYHTCPSKGKKCNNAKLKAQGGCTIWYDEPQYIKDIEKRIQAPVPPFDLQAIQAAGGISQYGQAKGAGAGSNARFESHFAVLKPTVQELALLEKRAQTSYLTMRYNQH
eukprot:TRINITY_DN3362_c1_g2_i2.p1 TRINITY_DN3362_c1_g2~~TRINITY_DN3362_c1_g2_i2.p1  ORF type:complete len:293 (+),score=68.89 TRINITY_DN3362_c1_g2_i2:96-974(+)